MRVTLVGTVATAVAIAMSPATANAASASRLRPIPASRIVARLRSGRAAIFGSVEVRTKLDLGSLGTIRAPFKCHACVFLGGIDASDAIFARTLDLSGSRILGAAIFEGATFQGPALFAAAPAPARFKRAADFSLAVFDDLASFDRARFRRDANFRLARFRSDASFAGTKFRRRALFTGAGLAGGADFDDASFAGARFIRATLATSDFRAAKFGEAKFGEEALFRRAVFRGATDFGATHFAKGGDFGRSQFSAGAQFVGAVFNTSAATGESAVFDEGGSGGDLDFSYADFSPGSNSEGVVSFNRFLCNGTLSLQQATFEPGEEIASMGLQAKSLVLDLGTTALVLDDPSDRTAPQRRHVLELIESSAKAKGDLVTANKAAYELHVLEARGYSWPRRLGDIVFYRWIAGYFVRPLRPLITLVVVALLISALRLVFQRRPARDGTRGRFLGLRRGLQHSGRFLIHFFDAIASVAPRISRGREEEPLARRLERALYRVLIACALIGLANSNPTLRQLVDSFL